MMVLHRDDVFFSSHPLNTKRMDLLLAESVFTRSIPSLHSTRAGPDIHAYLVLTLLTNSSNSSEQFLISLLET